MRRGFYSVYKISIANFINILLGIVRIKVYAIILGIEDLGVSSVILNLNMLIIFMASFGLPLGIIRFFSEWNNENKFESIEEVFRIILQCFLVVSFIMSFLCIFLSGTISLLLFDTKGYIYLIVLLGISLPFGILLSLLDATVRGLKEFNFYSNVSMIGGVVVTLISILLVYKYKLIGFGISISISSIVSILPYLVLLSKKKVYTISKVFSISLIKKNVLQKNKKYLTAILKLGMASLAMGIFDYSNILVLRSLINKVFGLEFNGIYQCVYAVSNNLQSIILMALSIYLIPEFSSIKDRVHFNNELNTYLKYSIIFIVPTILIIFVFRDQIILLFYTSEFLKASDLFPYSLLGDFFKILGTFFGLWFISNPKALTIILFNFVYNFFYLFSFIVLIYVIKIGFVSITIAYLVGSFFFMLVSLLLFKKQNLFKFSKINFKLLLLSILIVIPCFIISTFDRTGGYLFLILSFFIWIYVSFNSEDYTKLKLLFSNYLKK